MIFLMDIDLDYKGDQMTKEYTLTDLEKAFIKISEGIKEAEERQGFINKIFSFFKRFGK